MPDIFATWPWQHWLKERPSAVALSFDDQQFSWAELSARAEEYAQGLIEQGVKRDQLVAVIAPNSVSVLWLLLATLRVGARFVGLNPRASQAEINEQLAQLQPDYVWYPAKTELTLDVAPRLHLLPPEHARLVPVTWQPTRAATLTLTSGSTGVPKAVVHSAHTHLASAAGLLEWFEFSAEDSWLLSLPIFHISGMAIIWRWLYRGAQLTVCSPHQFSEALQTVTHASLVPTQLQRVLESDSVSSLSLKRVLLGGAMIPSSLTQQASERGIECWSGYGMTEMASTVTAKLANGSEGVGAVLPYREVTLKDGEVMVRGAALCLGYYRNKTIFPVSEHEWFATKDLACWQDEELHIQGRADHMFISGGENVQPEDIEKVLLAHPSVTQAFVLPQSDPEFGQRPVAIIDTEAELDEALIMQLSAYMKQHVAAFKRPIRYICLPIALQGNGIKVSRHALTEWLAQA
ncbi:o-succinylbenzoate--CoA ligase [Photobacterium nomapromontoriensis]|uniref:o-succinylbenzoate--CoA ligase n=1 Tax=Photobacterium nomapromontoriensis TaxID=2910237 RepID=UPI003D0EC952